GRSSIAASSSVGARRRNGARCFCATRRTAPRERRHRGRRSDPRFPPRLEFAKPRATRAARYDRSIMTTAAKPKAGLEDTVATSSAICYLDGDRGVLAYCGFDIHDLARHATFEEVCFLLWHR